MAASLWRGALPSAPHHASRIAPRRPARPRAAMPTTSARCRHTATGATARRRVAAAGRRRRRCPRAPPPPAAKLSGSAAPVAASRGAPSRRGRTRRRRGRRGAGRQAGKDRRRSRRRRAPPRRRPRRRRPPPLLGCGSRRAPLCRRPLTRRKLGLQNSLPLFRILRALRLARTLRPAWRRPRPPPPPPLPCSHDRRCAPAQDVRQPKTHVVHPVHRAVPDASPPAANAARRDSSSFWQSFLCAPQSSV